MIPVINNYQKIIESVNKMGLTVLQIFPSQRDDSAFFFLVNNFTPAMHTSVEDITFNQLTGINITNIVSNNTTTDSRQFEHVFNEYIRTAAVVRLEFSTNVRWFKYAPWDK